MSAAESAAPDISGIAEADAGQLAAMVAQVSDEQLAEAMSNPEARSTALGEIFNRMADHVKPEQIGDLEAIVHFRITEAPDGGVDVWEVELADGTCKVRSEPTTEEPRVSLQMAPVPFLRLATGAESGPALFMTGKLKIKGDLMLASRMASFFRIPSA